MKPKHQRLIFIAVSVIFLCGATLLTLRAFRDNIIFFYSPSDIKAQTIENGRRVRIGGLVATGSIVHNDKERIRFDITDGTASVHVTYQGILPNLFREGQGVVAEGRLVNTTEFEADRILAKHDENYMPKEVIDALKRSGRWKGNP